jgi:hypothetical protein
VLVNSEDMAVLASELRKKINDKIKLWAKSDTPTEMQNKIVSAIWQFHLFH